MLEIRAISKRYGAVTALAPTSFQLAGGEILGYLGPNGSGKSTTVRILAGLMTPTTGAVLYRGEDIRDDLPGYKAHLGYVPEEAHVYTHLTAPEYLRLCGQLRGVPARRLDTKIDRFLRVFGLDVSYHTQMSGFSKGMRQKVLLAAALLNRPRILILDEPASGLDVGTALVLRSIVRGLAESGAAVFYSSHELDTVERIATRVMIVCGGEVKADDSVGNLRTLMHAPSLEEVFTQLAVQHDVEATAAAVVETAHL